MRELRCKAPELVRKEVRAHVPAYNLIRAEQGRLAIELCVPGGMRQSLGEYPRDWPEELSARHADPFVRAQRGISLADEADR